MKKRGFLTFLVSIFYICIMAFSNVFGYNLVFKSKVFSVPDGAEGTQLVYRFITGARSSENSREIWNSSVKDSRLTKKIDGVDNRKWLFYDTFKPNDSVKKLLDSTYNNTSNDYQNGGMSYYNTKELFFYSRDFKNRNNNSHTKYFTSKPSGTVSNNTASNKAVPVSWIEGRNVEFADTSYLNGSSQTGWVVTNDTIGGRISGIRDVDAFQEYAAARLRVGVFVDANIHLEMFQLTTANIKDIFTAIGKNINTSDDKYIGYTVNNATTRYWFNKSDGISSDSNLSMDTAWKFYRVTQTYDGFAEAGQTWAPGTTGYENNRVAADLSTVNEYDNFLLIPPDKPRTVIVRHYDISGNQIHEKIDSKGTGYYRNESAKVEHKVTPGQEDILKVEDYGLDDAGNRKTFRRSTEKYDALNTDKITLKNALEVINKKDADYKYVGYIIETIETNANKSAGETEREKLKNSMIDKIKSINQGKAKVDGANSNVVIKESEKAEYVYVYYIYEKAEDRTIIVNHKDTNGNNIANTQHEKSINGTGDTAANPDVPKTPVKNLWWQTSGKSGQEKYEIKGTENIRVRNAMDILSKGDVEYKYWGYMVVTEETQDAAEKKINSKLEAFVSATSDASKKLMLNGKETEEVYAQKKQTKGKEKADYTYVYFIYEKVVKKHREVYVRHIEYDPETGTKKVLSGVGNKESADNPTIPVTTPIKSGFNEYYKIDVADSITLSRVKEIKGGDDYYYDYMGYYSTVSFTYTDSKGLTGLAFMDKFKNSNLNGLNSAYTMFSQGVKEVNHTFVDFYYQKEKTKGEKSQLELIGNLSFINQATHFYSSTAPETVGTSVGVDYIPSGEDLVPYVNNAYPYVLRGANYEFKEKKAVLRHTVSVTASWTGTYTASVSETISSESSYIPPSYYDIVFSSKEYYTVKEEDGEEYICNEVEDKKGNKKEECDWVTKYKDVEKWTQSYTAKEERTVTGGDYTSLEYSIPYEFKWFVLKNFKMYAIENFELYDDESNKGGTLFSTPRKYIINPSTEYKNMIASGFIGRNAQSATASGSLSFSNSAHCGTNSDCPELVTWAKNKIDPYRGNYYKAAADSGATATIYNRYNDYVTLDGGDVLQKIATSRYNTLERTYSLTDSRFWGSGNSSPYEDTKFYMAENTEPSKNMYISNAINYVKVPTSKRTVLSDYINQNINIIKERVNGLRIPRAVINYKVIGTNSNINVPYNSRLNLGADSFRDMVVEKDRQVTSKDLQPADKSISGREVNEVVVYTPLVLPKISVVTKSDYVNHTNIGGANMIQRNAWFAMKLYTGSEPAYNNIPTLKYLKDFYLTFDFDVDEVRYYYGSTIDFNRINSSTRASTNISADNAIKIPANAKEVIVFVKTTKDYADPTVTQVENGIRIYGSAYNVPNLSRQNLERDLMYNMRVYQVPNFIDDYAIEKYSGTSSRQGSYLGRTDIIKDAFHMATAEIITTTNLGRIFDFRVTDVTDVDYKDTFRKDDNKTVNSHTGNVYYSGTKSWNRYSVNEMYNNQNNGRILPLSPYKEKFYVYAPKLGYRFSYELKTSGYLTSSRYVEITPSFFFIKKDGTGYTTNIKLYYKDSSEKYVSIDNYKIYFTPNDGYRYLLNIDITGVINNMSTKIESLNVSNKMKLDSKFMATSNNGYYQSWYGEYKLPNSTVAFTKISEKEVDINNPLTDGYIGVVFNIKAVDPNGTISYNKDNKQSGKSNTSQWDYEGYMGFNSPGSAANLSLKLEKGTWNISNDIYNKIKGTVILYDADRRASQDFE